MEISPQTKNYYLPSIADLIFLTILLYLSFYDTSGMLGDGDTGYHIRAGEYIIKTFSIPKLDMFSFHTPPLHWTAHEWLSEVIMAYIHRAFGLTGVVVFFSFLLSLAHYLLFRILRSYTSNILWAILVIILVIGSSLIHWLARPHIFSLLLMIIWYYLLESWHYGRRDRLYLLPLIMLLWVNLHGGFLGGFMLLGAYLAGNIFNMLTATPSERGHYQQKCRQLGLTIGVCLFACLVNPLGYHILLFPFKLVSDKYIMDHVSEFLSPNFHERMPFKYLLFLLITLFAITKKRLDAVELVLVLLFTNMALYSARYIPLFALIVAPIITRHANYALDFPDNNVTRFFRKRAENISKIDASVQGYLWPIMTVLIVAIAVISGKIQHTFDDKIKAVAAVEFLEKERISGNMFNNDEIGDYIIYRTYPLYKVFIDGRLDMYGTGIMKEYSKVTKFEHNWEDTFKKYNIKWVIFDTDSVFSRFLLHNNNWTLIYSDKVASIFVKNLPEYSNLIEKYSSVKPYIPEDTNDAR
ncbi:hypothetical protein [Geobacter sp. AOG1]|uniref:hypothetical protein n=1 Tax=Geobacter sp. AOG1 TaxID=1566346 RepID=UPI001CC679E0|nr:hypothetical protein [Geobacter sp. AOG1]GFE58402.1 hypothetical protein AOG1_22820 [Geobacter sp. AOG1]